MKRYFGIPVLALGMTLGYIAAQQARHEITKASPGDKKGLSASVPDVYAIPGQFQRIVVLRFKNQTDLLAGLTKMVAEQKIRSVRPSETGRTMEAGVAESHGILLWGSQGDRRSTEKET